MKQTIIRALGALGIFSALAWGASQGASAADKATDKADKAAKGPKGKAANSGTIEKTIQLAPKGLSWGMDFNSLTKLYEKVLDDEYLPLFKKTEPGPEEEAIEDELKRKKSAFRRSRVEFGKLPMGVDQTPLKGEYSYENGESMAHLTLKSGTERYLFFFDDHLWKIYDEHKLSKDSLGESFDEAVKTLAKRFSAAPKLVSADPGKGQNFDEAQWQDPEKMIRALDRGNAIAMVYADKKVQNNLERYRRNKPQDLHVLDKEVAAVTAQPPADPAKPVVGKGDAKKDEAKKKK